MSEPRRRTVRAIARAVLAVGVLLGVGLIVWSLLPPPAAPVPDHTFDRRPSRSAQIESATAARRTPTSRGPESTSSPKSSRGGETAPPTPTPPGIVGGPLDVPVRVRIPSLGVDAPVRAEDVDPRGELVVPGDPHVVGAWQGRDERLLVLAGHVDMEGDLGALHGVSRLRPDAEVLLVDAAGRERRLAVEALEVRHKDDLPDFDAPEAVGLALVTCGGPIVQTEHGRGYRDNVIAWATPVGS